MKAFLFVLIFICANAYPDYIYKVATTNKDYGVHSVVTHILDDIDVRYNTTSYPPKRLYSYLRKGKMDIWTASKELKAINAHVVYSEEPVLCLKLSAFSVDSPEIKSKEDLRGKSIILIHGFTYLGWLDYFTNPDNGIDVQTISSQKLAYSMLEAGRADYFLDYQVATLENKNLVEFPDFTLYDFWMKPIYFVYSKKAHGLKTLKGKVDHYLKTEMNSENAVCKESSKKKD